MDTWPSSLDKKVINQEKIGVIIVTTVDYLEAPTPQRSHRWIGSPTTPTKQHGICWLPRSKTTSFFQPKPTQNKQAAFSGLYEYRSSIRSTNQASHLAFHCLDTAHVFNWQSTHIVGFVGLHRLREATDALKCDGGGECNSAYLTKSVLLLRMFCPEEIRP